MTLAELLQLFLDWCQRNRSPRTVTYYRGLLEPWVKKVGDKPADQVVALDLVQHSTGRALTVAVQRLFNWAAKVAKVVSATPFKEVEKPRSRRRKRTVDRGDFAILARHAQFDFRAVLVCCRETACRPQEVRLLEWDWLCVEDPRGPFWGQLVAGRGFFVLEDYKAAERRDDDGPSRIIPVSPRLGRLLLRLALQRRAEGIIFRNAQGKPWTKNALVLRMRRLRERAGLGQRVRGELICLYTLRHSAASAWAAAGLPAKTLGDLLGHVNLKTTQRYLHLERYRQIEGLRRLWQQRPGKDKRQGQE